MTEDSEDRKIGKIAAKRAAVSPRRRFEIFKRDGFRCVYCGRTPPAVILHADHILALARGGTDELSNLATSCSECNLGKAAGLLSDRPEGLSSSQNADRDRFDQLREFNEWLAERAAVKDRWVQQVSDVWITLEHADPNQWMISDERASTVRMFLDRLPAQEIIDALHITNARYPANSNRFFKYFCGVCWNKVKERNH